MGNDDSSFEKDYKDIYPTELELKKENNSNFYASFLDIYIYIENKEFHNVGFDIVRMPFYCSNFPSKMFYWSNGAAFCKIENLSSTCTFWYIKNLTYFCIYIFYTFYIFLYFLLFIYSFTF